MIAKPTKAQPAKNVDYSKAITPLADRIVVRVESPERVTSGGLIIPETVSQAAGFLKATVLAVGAGGTNKKGMLRPLDVKVGDTVLFAEHSGTKVQFNSEDLQIIHEYDVMGIFQ
ncbi:MAG: co-chaperone GroES [Bdellovibrio sp.]|nr:co-chaperone GroES [Bdellovibrio sp.]